MTKKLDFSVFDAKKYTDTKNAQHGLPMIPVSAFRPTLDDPKHEQEYCSYTDASPFPDSKCGNCKFFIKGDGGMDNVCQLIKATPKRIVGDGYCRFYDHFSKLEGFIETPLEVDDSLPTDMSEMFSDEKED